LKKGWRAGLAISFGHALVEFPFIISIAFGIAMFLTNEIAVKLIGGVGSILLIYLGIGMISDALKEQSNAPIARLHEKPLLLGALLSALNPFFLIWWIFIGGILIIEAISLFGYIGIIILFVMHVWLDFVWLIGLSQLSYKGKNIMKTKGYKVTLAVIGILLIIFAIDLIASIFIGQKILPF